MCLFRNHVASPSGRARNYPCWSCVLEPCVCVLRLPCGLRSKVRREAVASGCLNARRWRHRTIAAGAWVGLPRVRLRLRRGGQALAESTGKNRNHQQTRRKTCRTVDRTNNHISIRYYVWPLYYPCYVWPLSWPGSQLSTSMGLRRTHDLTTVPFNMKHYFTTTVRYNELTE